MDMYCYQCEQAKDCTACTTRGVCGKDPVTAALQDLLVHALKEIAEYAHRARSAGGVSKRVDDFTADALFTTVTNVNFDPERMTSLMREAGAVLDEARELCRRHCPEHRPAAALPAWRTRQEETQLLEEAVNTGIAQRIKRLGADAAGVQELLLAGVKGTAAYAVHARRLGEEDPAIAAFFHKALAYLANPAPDMQTLLGLCLECGQINLRTMEILDAAHTKRFGAPQPTPVRVTPVRGKAILVSGHDLGDLEDLLKQTAGKGINIYTHGEMLPAHGYPELKKYPHLVGNYGGAWQNQATEFEDFPGAILMTTNCIQRPQESYQARIFTAGLVAWPGVAHIPGNDFSPVIEAALAAPGFAADDVEKTVLVGFGHQAVLGAAEQILGAVKSGALRHFFLIGGCDGAKPGRNYYSEFAHAVPKDCAILTLACGKYRFNKDDFGTIGGLPRLLDVGQCNDAYSAIKIAAALAGALQCDVNALPLSLILSWYEQKAVAILLTLLSLGIRNIRLGPTMPACVTPPVLALLQEQFQLHPITTVEQDLASCLNKAAA